MRITCDFCNGRGWHSPDRPDAHAEACAFCKGAGSFTLAQVASRIEEDTDTVKRLIKWRFRERGTPRKATALRIFDKLAALAWPNGVT